MGLYPQGWIHDWLRGWNSNSNENIFAAKHAMTLGSGNQVFYRGTDDKVHAIFWWNNAWTHDWIGGWNAPTNQNIVGDIVAGTGNELFYRGADGKMHVYYWWNGNWIHDWLRGPNVSTGENVAGDISISDNDQIMYAGIDAKMHVYYWNNGWVHDWLESSWQAPSLHNVSGPIRAGTNGQVFYRGVDGKCRVYYWQQGYAQKNSNNKSNYSMYETEKSPTLPKTILSESYRCKVFPNPFKNKIEVELPENLESKYGVTITDLMGKIIFRKEYESLNTQIHKIDLGSLSNGMYLLKITNSNGFSQVEKIVKE